MVLKKSYCKGAHSQEGKHTIVEGFSITKLSKIFKKTFVTTSAINDGGFSEGFNGYFI